MIADEIRNITKLKLYHDQSLIEAFETTKFFVDSNLWPWDDNGNRTNVKDDITVKIVWLIEKYYNTDTEDKAFTRYYVRLLDFVSDKQKRAVIEGHPDFPRVGFY